MHSAATQQLLLGNAEPVCKSTGKVIIPLVIEQPAALIRQPPDPGIVLFGMLCHIDLGPVIPGQSSHSRWHAGCHRLHRRHM